jgi:heme/copper-type cytochrome/quinol oxidase subunit 2
MKSTFALFLVLVTMVMIPIVVDYAFAAPDEPGQYLDRRVVIWNLFYRMMTVAFTVGAVVSGTIVWLCWRFRESNPKSTPTPYEKEGVW